VSHSQTTTYPVLEENPTVLDQKELFCRCLPYPLARSYFCMLNQTGQRRVSYFLELVELSLKFYYFLFASLLNWDCLRGRLSLGQSLSQIKKLLKRNTSSDNYDLDYLRKSFQDNLKLFQKLIRLRNRLWAHGKTLADFDYDREYLFHFGYLNQLLLPILQLTKDYFVIEEIIAFDQDAVLAKVLKFLGFNPFGKRELVSLRLPYQKLKQHQIFLSTGGILLNLDQFQRFDYCEICHADSFFILKDQLKNKQVLTSFFYCVHCGCQRFFSVKALDK
jgi:hypothetical protein